MGKFLHKVFKDVSNEINNEFTTLVESGSEVLQLIPEPRNFEEVTRLPVDVKKDRLKSTLKEIKELINNNTFLMDEPDKGDPVTPCMGVYKAKILSNGSIEKLKLIIVVRGDS